MPVAELPEWATALDAGVELPPESYRQNGWGAERPPANWQNWLHKRTYDWLQYLDSVNGLPLARALTRSASTLSLGSFALSRPPRILYSRPGGRWYLIGTDAIDDYLWTSTDADTWSLATSPSNLQITNALARPNLLEQVATWNGNDVSLNDNNGPFTLYTMDRGISRAVFDPNLTVISDSNVGTGSFWGRPENSLTTTAMTGIAFDIDSIVADWGIANRVYAIGRDALGDVRFATAASSSGTWTEALAPTLSGQCFLALGAGEELVAWASNQISAWQGDSWSEPVNLSGFGSIARIEPLHDAGGFLARVFNGSLHRFFYSASGRQWEQVGPVVSLADSDARAGFAWGQSRFAFAGEDGSVVRSPGL